MNRPFMIRCLIYGEKIEETIHARDSQAICMWFTVKTVFGALVAAKSGSLSASEKIDQRGKGTMIHQPWDWAVTVPRRNTRDAAVPVRYPCGGIWKVFRSAQRATNAYVIVVRRNDQNADPVGPSATWTPVRPCQSAATGTGDAVAVVKWSDPRVQSTTWRCHRQPAPGIRTI